MIGTTLLTAWVLHSVPVVCDAHCAGCLPDEICRREGCVACDFPALLALLSVALPGLRRRART
jgi:hypothetical protein